MSWATSNAASISIIEPLEISKYLFLSASDFLENPSARFRNTDNAALLICCTKANFSSGGNVFVSE